MDRLVGSFKQHKSNGHGAHSHSLIPAIHITQMTIDEGTDDEMLGENNKWAKKTQMEERKGKGAEEKGENGGVAECSKAILENGGNGPSMGPKESCASQPDKNGASLLLSANKYQDRTAVNRQSTGTLNRLILVAQALENEVDWRRRNDVNSSRVVFTLRMANIVLLLLINLLLFTGVGQYHDRNGMRISLFLTMDKWNYIPGYPIDEVPPTFAEMRLTGQFCAAALAIAMFLCTVLLQCIHCLRIRHSKLLCIFYAFACVPVTLFIFGLEMHYSACPWLDDFYQSQLLRRNFHSMEKYFDTQCGINGWALAGIFSLLSCGLFVSDGLISAFFRADDSHGNEQEKSEAIL